MTSKIHFSSAFVPHEDTIPLNFYLMVLMHYYCSVPYKLLCKILHINGLCFDVTNFFTYTIPYKLIEQALLFLTCVYYFDTHKCMTPIVKNNLIGPGPSQPHTTVKMQHIRSTKI